MTAPHGREFGADLYKLSYAGRETLPSAANAFAVANGHVADTDQGLGIAFTRPKQFGGERGPAYEAWTGLRDLYQTILAETAKSLEMVGEALCLTATEYAKADGAARERLDELIRDEQAKGGPPAPTPPPLRYPPGADRSGLRRK